MFTPLGPGCGSGKDEAVDDDEEEEDDDDKIVVDGSVAVEVEAIGVISIFGRTFISSLGFFSLEGSILKLLNPGVVDMGRVEVSLDLKKKRTKKCWVGP